MTKETIVGLAVGYILKDFINYKDYYWGIKSKKFICGTNREVLEFNCDQAIGMNFNIQKFEDRVFLGIQIEIESGELIDLSFDNKEYDSTFNFIIRDNENLSTLFKTIDEGMKYFQKTQIKQ